MSTTTTENPFYINSGVGGVANAGYAPVLRPPSEPSYIIADKQRLELEWISHDAVAWVDITWRSLLWDRTRTERAIAPLLQRWRHLIDPCPLRLKRRADGTDSPLRFTTTIPTTRRPISFPPNCPTARIIPMWDGLATILTALASP